MKTDELNGLRVCNLVSRPDYDGFGFSMRPADKGPHQVSSVEQNSPAMFGGLKPDDLILKVNDVNVVGERYSKTISLIKNESQNGRLKLEVIDSKYCPIEIRNTPLMQSAPSTVSKRDKKKPSSTKNSVENLRNITQEAIDTDRRSVSADPGSERTKQRPLSMTDLNRGTSTVRSGTSFGSTMTGISAVPSRSEGNLALASRDNKPKFKRCNVQLLEGSKSYGFTLNSKVKPKYMIFSVDPNSPAYAANLRTTDVIVEIDGKNIRRLKFDQVKQLIVNSQKNGKVEILAISKEGYMYYKEKRKRFSSRKLVTLDNTEPYSSINGLSTLTLNRAVSSENSKFILVRF